MIVLHQNDAKLKKYNDRMRELQKQYPEDAEYFHTINGLDDVFCPYSSWLSQFTEKDKQELRVIADKQYDFTGIYITRDFNDHYEINMLTDSQEDDSWFYDYGVVDNATQILDNITVQDNAVVLMTPVFKTDEEYGWRWHKWGRYYGVQNPKCEYLNDEENIEMIYCFRVVNLKGE